MKRCCKIHKSAKSIKIESFRVQLDLGMLPFDFIIDISGYQNFILDRTKKIINP